MSTARQRFGRRAEALAVRRLEADGYRILVRNYRTRLGEVDIIARDGDTLVFVEVKARRTARYGSPKLAVTAAKQRRISMAALQYLKAAGCTGARARFDVVAITEAGDGPRVEIVKNAFELAYQ